MNSLFQEWKQDIKNTNDLKKSIRHTVASFSISNNAAIHALSPLLVVLEKLQDRVEEIDLLVEDVVVYFQPAFREEMNVFLQDWNEMIDSIESKQLKVEIPRLPEFFFLPLEYQEVEEED